MKVLFSDRFAGQFRAAPEQVQRTFGKQLGHLRAKKYDEARNLWQARVDQDWRFYFSVAADTYYLHEIKPHPK